MGATRTFSALAAVVATVVGGGLSTPASAAPVSATPGCATDAEFARVQSGMRAVQVYSIIGGTGKLIPDATGQYGDVARDFPYCGTEEVGNPLVVRIRFTQAPDGTWRVSDKEVP